MVSLTQAFSKSSSSILVLTQLAFEGKQVIFFIGFLLLTITSGGSSDTQNEAERKNTKFRINKRTSKQINWLSNNDNDDYDDVKLD